MKKNILSMMAGALLVVGLVACGGDTPSSIKKCYEMVEYQDQLRNSGDRAAASKYVNEISNGLESSPISFNLEIDGDIPIRVDKFEARLFNGESFTLAGDYEITGDVRVGDLTLVFTIDDQPVQVHAVEDYSQQSRFQSTIRFPIIDGKVAPEMKLVNRILLTKKSVNDYSAAIEENIKRIRQTSQKTDVDETPSSDAGDELTPSDAGDGLIFSNGSLGPVKVGNVISKLPDSVEGLYDKYSYKKIEHEGNEMDDPWTEEYYLFTKDGKNIFRANMSGKTVYSIYLMEGSTFIKTSDGFSVGSSVRDLFNKRRLEWDNYYDGTVFGFGNHYYFYFNAGDLVGTDIPQKAEHFKKDAKITGIAYVND